MAVIYIQQGTYVDVGAHFPHETGIELQVGLVEAYGVFAVLFKEALRFLDFIKAYAVEICRLCTVAVFDVNAKFVFVEKQCACACCHESPVQRDVESYRDERTLAYCVGGIHAEAHQGGASDTERGFRVVGGTSQNGYPDFLVRPDGIPFLLTEKLFLLRIGQLCPVLLCECRHCREKCE